VVGSGLTGQSGETHNGAGGERGGTGCDGLSPAPPVHPWDVTPAEARAIQERLRDGVGREDDFGPVRLVAGTDVAFEDAGRITRGAVAVLEFPSLELVEHAVARLPTRFPYVPGLLSFREIPALLEALARLGRRPDLVLCDGQGIAHPRRFGLACHFGVLTGLPCIGVAKSRLIGSHEEPPADKGGRADLFDGDELIGAVVRSRSGVRPLYVSTGHRVGLESAVRYTLACCPRYRLPETTRWADRLAAAP
jgi:deoxyribonuclease V